MRESIKNKDGQWYSVEKAVVDSERTEMGEVNGQKGVLRANIYDKNGDPLLMVIEIPMDGIPIQMLEQFRQALTVQNLTPIMLIPPQVKCLQLKAMSDVQVRRMMTSTKEADKPELPPPEQRRIIVP